MSDTDADAGIEGVDRAGCIVPWVIAFVVEKDLKNNGDEEATTENVISSIENEATNSIEVDAINN